MIELIFVIVVMGILGKFGVEFLAQAYKSFIFASVNNKLQSDSASAVEFIATRLQHRIKDSVVVRTAPGAAIVPLSVANPSTSYMVLEWFSADADGFRGVTTPNWSGIIDLEHPNTSATTLQSPGTNTASINALIGDLSDDASGISDAALYFIGSNTGTNASLNPAVMHPINSVSGEPTQFSGSFAGIDVFEYYKLSWSANAIVITNYANGVGDLVFYYDYQPWKGDSISSTTTKSFTLARGISTFQAIAIGSVMKLQVCAKSNLIAEETYSICKEKTIF
jgi:hypothetical protein